MKGFRSGETGASSSVAGSASTSVGKHTLTEAMLSVQAAPSPHRAVDEVRAPDTPVVDRLTSLFNFGAGRSTRIGLDQLAIGQGGEGVHIDDTTPPPSASAP